MAIASHQQAVNCFAAWVQGLVPLEGREGETVTKGLDTLEANCQQYYE